MVGVVLFSNGIIFLVQAKHVGEEQEERQKTRAPTIKGRKRQQSCSQEFDPIDTLMEITQKVGDI